MNIDEIKHQILHWQIMKGEARSPSEAHYINQKLFHLYDLESK